MWPSRSLFLDLSMPDRDHFFGLDPVHRQLLIGSALAVGGILAYLLLRRKPVKTLPVGEGWWGAGEKPPSEDESIRPFTVETSDKEIEVFYFIDVYQTKTRCKELDKDMLFNRTSTSALMEAVTRILWKVAPSSMASIPLTSRKWFHTGKTSLTGRSRWQFLTNIHTTKLKLKVGRLRGRRYMADIYIPLLKMSVF